MKKTHKGHKSRAISELGRQIVAKRFRFENTDQSPTGYTIHFEHMQRPLNCKVYTKKHDKTNGLDVTGRSEVTIHQLCKLKGEIMMIFVDAAAGYIYGDLLSHLMSNKTFAGVRFPYYLTNSMGRVVYFSVDKMEMLSELTKEEIDELAILMDDNRNPKNQPRLL